jgi:hypothetical protein
VAARRPALKEEQSPGLAQQSLDLGQLGLALQELLHAASSGRPR